MLLCGKRLTAQAAVLAGKSGQPRYAPLLKKLLLSDNEALRAAFDTERLLAGDDGEAGKYIGKNLLSGKRLTAQAAVLAGKSGQPRYAPLLKKLLLSDSEALNAAADFALTRLREDGATKPEANP